jgi:hypothetical protein
MPDYALSTLRVGARLAKHSVMTNDLDGTLVGFKTGTRCGLDSTHLPQLYFVGVNESTLNATVAGRV